MKYRPEIDGLRALAVIPVILFHAGFSLFKGGFVGVDIFFVISGYLITTILISDLSKEKFSIVEFYERRARRILPALFVMMGVTTVFAWFVMLPDRLDGYFKSILSVIFFSSNIYFWTGSGYFAVASEEKPLLHTWSLAVEEQYYIFFPLMLLFFWRLGKRNLLKVIILLSVVSFGVSELGWRYKPDANFFLPASRAWELFLGSIVAFLSFEKQRRSSNSISLFGLTLILLSIFLYDEHTPFPSYYAAVPVLGTALIIMFADSKTIAYRILSNKVLVGIGLISYSAYLWHQPIFALNRVVYGEEIPLLTMGLYSIVSIFLGYLSWKFIETPFRSKINYDRSKIFKISATVSLVFLVFSSFGIFYKKKIENVWLNSQTKVKRDTYKVVKALNTKTSNFGYKAGDDEIRLSQCRFNVRNLSSNIEERLIKCFKRHGPGKLVLGDSHAIDLYGVVSSRFNEKFLVGITQGFCRPYNEKDFCQYKKFADFIYKNKKIFDIVVFEQAALYLMKRNNGKEVNRSYFSSLKLNDTVEELQIDETAIDQTIQYLKSISRNIKTKWFLPRIEPHIHRSVILKNGCDYNFKLRQNQMKQYRKLDDILKNFLAKTNIIPVDQNQIFNFDFPGDFMNCKESYWSDGDHYTIEGEIKFGKRLPEDFLI